MLHLIQVILRRIIAASRKRRCYDALAPGRQADLIMVRTDSVAVFPLTNAIGTIVQAIERSDLDTVMVAGQIRKRAGHLIGVDLAKLRTEVDASRDYLLKVSGHRPDLFSTAATAKAA